MSTAAIKERIEWVDYAKGICIILVVMMHSTLGVERVTGDVSWLHGFIKWAQPFRMPDFFLISGLFLAGSIQNPWRKFIDKKMIHFAYFYVLWLSISFIFKAPHMMKETGVIGVAENYLISFVQPFSSLWFIYLLMIFFVVTKILNPLPRGIIWFVAAVLHCGQFSTGWILVDEFTARFVFFYSGYIAAPYIFDFANLVKRGSSPAIICGLLIWAVLNGWMVNMGHAADAGISLILGYIGAGAVITAGIFLARNDQATFVRYCGANSMIIYLAFFVFMATSRTVLLKLDLIADAGTLALLVTAISVVGPLVLFKLSEFLRLGFLFKRPKSLHLVSPNISALQQRQNSSIHK